MEEFDTREELEVVEDENQVLSDQIIETTNDISEYPQDSVRNALIDAINKGSNKISNHLTIQKCVPDDSYFKVVDEALTAINNIIRTPKLSIADSRELMRVEQAKKTDAYTVRHLASHTEYIREIRDDMIIPTKVSVKVLNEERAIYENKFVYALILRLRAFLEDRYEDAKAICKIRDCSTLTYDMKFKVAKVDMDVKLNVEMGLQPENELQSKQNLEHLHFLKRALESLKVLEGSKFCRTMAKSKVVTSPIQRTNILMNHPDYSACYRLWYFISNYFEVKNEIQTCTKQLPVNDEYVTDLVESLADTTQAIFNHNNINAEASKKAPLDPVRKTKYKVYRNTDCTIKRAGSAYQDGSEVNDYYYRKMKKFIPELENLSVAIDEDDRGIEVKDFNFRSFFKGIEKINNKMYAEVLNLDTTDDKEYPNPLAKQKARLQKQKKDCERYMLLMQLKDEELRLAKKRLETQKKKLEKVTLLYDKEVEKENNRKAKEQARKEKEKAKKEAAKARLAAAKAKKLAAAKAKKEAAARAKAKKAAALAKAKAAKLKAAEAAKAAKKANKNENIGGKKSEENC